MTVPGPFLLHFTPFVYGASYISSENKYILSMASNHLSKNVDIDVLSFGIVTIILSSTGLLNAGDENFLRVMRVPLN